MRGGVGPRDFLITHPHHPYHLPLPSTHFYLPLTPSHPPIYPSFLTPLSLHPSTSSSVFLSPYSLQPIPKSPYPLGYPPPLSSHAHTILTHSVHTYSLNPFPTHISPLFFHFLLYLLLSTHTCSSILSFQTPPNHSSLSHSNTTFHFHTKPLVPLYFQKPSFSSLATFPPYSIPLSHPLMPYSPLSICAQILTFRHLPHL